jgi:uncharacterized NAD(P)/FAD-binding protein YdhS
MAEPKWQRAAAFPEARAAVVGRPPPPDCTRGGGDHQAADRRGTPPGQGRIVGATQEGNGLEVDIQRRGADESQRVRFDYAFNCTGPLHSIDRTKDPLLRSLLDKGATQADHLGIGLAVDENARAGERLWALGPLTKGRYWEIIAVPDIREQAAAVAEDIRRELSA